MRHFGSPKPERYRVAKRQVDANDRMATRGKTVFTAEQAESDGGEVVKSIVSWRSPCRYWAAHFSKLKV